MPAFSFETVAWGEEYSPQFFVCESFLLQKGMNYFQVFSSDNNWKVQKLIKLSSRGGSKKTGVNLLYKMKWRWVLVIYYYSYIDYAMTFHHVRK